MATEAIRAADPDALKQYYQDVKALGGVPKPEPRKKIKGQKDRVDRKQTGTVREYVMARERNICRCCRLREATSMHELRFRSLGGKVSRTNSVGVCGDGTRMCHGFLQRNEIRYAMDLGIGAEGTIVFTPQSPASAEWLHVALGEQIESKPMCVMEAE